MDDIPVLPTSAVAAVGDAVVVLVGLAGKIYAENNTPEMHNARLAGMNAEHLAAIREALERNDLAALRLLVTPTTT